MAVIEECLLCFVIRPVVRTTANAAIKSRATELSVSQFIRDRETVERELFKALKTRLEGVNTKQSTDVQGLILNFKAMEETIVMWNLPANTDTIIDPAIYK